MKRENLLLLRLLRIFASLIERKKQGMICYIVKYTVNNRKNLISEKKTFSFLMFAIKIEQIFEKCY